MVDLSSVVRPGDGIIWGQACAEPQTLVEALVAQRAATLAEWEPSSARATPASSSRSTPTICGLSSYCGTGTQPRARRCRRARHPARALLAAGRADPRRADPMPTWSWCRSARPTRRANTAWAWASSTSRRRSKKARAVIAEVNDQVPWTWTEPLLREEDFALVVQSSRPPVYLDFKPRASSDRAIARHAAAFIPERRGARMRHRVAAQRGARRAARAAAGCAYHSGAICDGVVDLDARSSAAPAAR